MNAYQIKVRNTDGTEEIHHIKALDEFHAKNGAMFFFQLYHPEKAESSITEVRLLTQAEGSGLQDTFSIDGQSIQVEPNHFLNTKFDE